MAGVFGKTKAAGASSPASAAASADKKKQTIIVIGTVALVGIAYFTLKKTGTSTTGTTAATTASDTGTVASGGVNATDASTNQSQLDSITGQLTSLTASVGTLNDQAKAAADAAKAASDAAAAAAAKAAADTTGNIHVLPPHGIGLVPLPSVSPLVKTPVATTTKGKKPASQTNFHIYTVKKGDNLTKIARENNVAGGWKAIYANPANKKAVGSNPNLIHPGDKLQLPGKASK